MAVASVGATAAPTTHATGQATPKAWTTTATIPAVTTTSSVPLSRMPRMKRRISRGDVVSDSQYSSGGRKSSNTTSWGRAVPRSWGIAASASPQATSTIGCATRMRSASTEPTRRAAPSATTSSRPCT